MKKTKTNKSPILEMGEGFIINQEGDLTMAFEMQKQEIFSLGKEGYMKWHHTWTRILRLLPPGFIVHLQDIYLETEWQPPTPNEADFLSQASDRFFTGRKYFEHRSYLFLTRCPAKRKPSAPGWSSLLWGSPVPSDTMNPGLVKEHVELTGQIEQLLADGAKVGIRKLSETEIEGGRKAGIIEQYMQLQFSESAEAVKNQPVLADIRFNPNPQPEINIGAKQLILFTLSDSDLPDSCSPYLPYAPYSDTQYMVPVGFASELGTLLPCNHIYNQVIRIEDPAPTLKKLELKRRRLGSLSTHARENEKTKAAVDAFLDEATGGERKMVLLHCNVAAWAGDGEELDNIRKMIVSNISRTGATPHIETLCAPQIWWGCIPGNAGDIALSEFVNTFAEQAACFLIAESHYRDANGAGALRLGDRITGRPINVIIGSEALAAGYVNNLHKVILSASGSGKSFFCNALTHSYLVAKYHVVIVDIGNSYKGLCALCNGRYFAYAEDSPLRFNPFRLIEGEILTIEKKESIKTLLLALWKRDTEEFQRSEYVGLSNALQLYFDKLNKYKGIRPCFDTFYEFLKNEFASNLKADQVKVHEFDIDNFLYILKPFYKDGEYAWLLNAEEEMDLLNERLIIFELDNIRNNPILFNVVTIVIMDVIMNKMRRLPGSRKAVLMEEAWQALARKGMSEYVLYLVKTFRKFNGELITVSQEIEDMISNPIVKMAIINNSDTRILLDQQKFRNRFEPIQELLGMTDDEVALALSVNKANEPGKSYKEVFISMQNAPAKVYRTEVSREEYYCYTTREDEKVQVQAYAVKHGGIAEGIDALIKDRQKK